LREAAALAEFKLNHCVYVSARSSIWQSQDRNGYTGCLIAEKKLDELFGGCVAENSLQSVLMLSFAADFYDGELT
jgi:hypothetical protein